MKTKPKTKKEKVAWLRAINSGHAALPKPEKKDREVMWLTTFDNEPGIYYDENKKAYNAEEYARLKEKYDMITWNVVSPPDYEASEPETPGEGKHLPGGNSAAVADTAFNPAPETGSPSAITETPDETEAERKKRERAEQMAKWEEEYRINHPRPPEPPEKPEPKYNIRISGSQNNDYNISRLADALRKLK